MKPPGEDRRLRMKKKLWLLTVLAVVVLLCTAGYFLFIKQADIQIDEKHFPDSAFREAIMEYDPDQDGKLSAKEIRDITFIDIHNRGIENLQGIEYLTELTAISGGYNNLTELDVSQNTKLDRLDVIDNQLT